MREAYYEQLDTVTGRLVGMANKTGEQIAVATRALLDADIQLADKTVAADGGINRDQLEVDELVLELLATQGPVASDLRTVLSALRTTADLERMGDLAVHVAKVTRMRYPDNAVPEEFRSTFEQMGTTAETMAAKAGRVLESRDLDAVTDLAADDDEMDRLHRSLFVVMLDGEWNRGAEPAIDIALLGRYYERFADHAVHVGNHVRYLVTGQVDWIDNGPGH